MEQEIWIPCQHEPLGNALGLMRRRH
jgi:hypothetical protein